MESRKVRDDIDTMVSFTRQRHKEFMMARLQPLGIKTSSRGAVLYVVFENEGMVQDEISTRLSMDKAFVTRELNALSEAGLIHRLKDPQDHRRNHIFLTEKGKSIGEAIVKIEDDWVNAAYDGLSVSELKELRDYTSRVVDNIRNI